MCFVRIAECGRASGRAINTLVHLIANNVFLYTAYGIATLQSLN
jgi:hypothetical protein